VTVDASSAPRMPTILHCCFALLGVKMRLSMRGFHAAVRHASHRPTIMAPLSSATDEMVLATANRMATTAALWPTRARCLEQSLALTRVLGVRGVPVVFRIGVQPYRFRAHAWVEYKGLPIAEPGDGVSGFVPLPDIPL
jgi:hypothetical protein